MPTAVKTLVTTTLCYNVGCVLLFGWIGLAYRRGRRRARARVGDLSLGAKNTTASTWGVGIRIKAAQPPETIDDFAIYSDRTDETLPEDACFPRHLRALALPIPPPFRLAARRGWNTISWGPASPRRAAARGDEPAEAPFSLF